MWLPIPYTDTGQQLMGLSFFALKFVDGREWNVETGWSAANGATLHAGHENLAGTFWLNSDTGHRADLLY